MALPVAGRGAETRQRDGVVSGHRPAVIDGLEYAYLEGEPGPQVFSEIGFDVDGVRFKIRLDFGGAFVEPRGWFMNAGV